MSGRASNAKVDAVTGNRRRRVYTTFARAPSLVDTDALGATIIGLGDAVTVTELVRTYLRSNAADTFVFNGDTRLITVACALKWLLPGTHGRIVAVDMVLREPQTVRARLLAAVRKRLWRKVDRFIHYFRNTAGYQRVFGIGDHNSDYVPFKSNIHREALALKDRTALATGDYVFSAGRSLRDYRTLVEAARISGLPVAILFTSLEDWAAHGTVLNIDDRPPNVRLIFDDGSRDGWLKGLLGARCVAIPVKPESLCASGIGTYLDAMALGKPVIITRGPGADDVLTDRQALFVAPESPAELAAAMRRLWDDEQLASDIACAGRDYALGLGDEKDLLQRVFSRALAATTRAIGEAR